MTARICNIEECESIVTELYWYSEGPCPGVTPKNWVPRPVHKLNDEELRALTVALRTVRELLHLDRVSSFE